MQRHINISARPAAQQGVVLLVALIVLVAMTLAGIGIMRSVDTGTLVAGNIGFRQSAVASADSGIEYARTWLLNNQGALGNHASAAGYYATRQDNIDFTGNRTEGGATDGVDWTGADTTQPTKAVKVGTDSSGNTIYVVIHRLCTKVGGQNELGQSCMLSGGSGSKIGSSQNVCDYSECGLTNLNGSSFYRVTVRVDGAKNTTTYVQAMLLP